MQKINLKALTQVALLMAIEVILTRFCSINTPIVRIGFGFIPIAMMGMLHGPVWAACGAAMGDMLGALLFPTGAFFPGFTLTALLTGLTYGLLLHHKANLWRILLAVGIISLGLQLCLDTLWLYIIMEQGYLALLPTRILKCVIMAPAQVIVLRLVSARVYKYAGIGVAA